MTPERWEQVKRALDEVLESVPGARSAYLERIGTSDPELRQEIESLLRHYEAAGSQFLNSPAPMLLEEPVASFIGRQLGPYRLIEVLGTGGMGEVYRAARSDAEYEQQVAVKLVRTGQDPGIVGGRLRAERQILATFEHPNIARLLDGGTTEEGAPYLVMELIDGQPITTYCEEHRLESSARLDLFLHVCSAVQYAHERMVIHRDLKPSNILVTHAGVPKLLDFGIAKILESSAVPTRADATVASLRILTPLYASPEQMKGGPITAASDVYSLGVVLYELLTGTLPYPQSSFVDDPPDTVLARGPKKPSAVVLEVARSGGPGGTKLAGKVAVPGSGDAAARLKNRLRGDLDNIVLMALRAEPTRRYATVAQFAEDIRRHLRHLPVMARKPTLRYRASSFVARHTVGVAATALIALALIGGAVMTAREAHIAELQRSRAERRFNDLRELAHALIFEIHDSILELPGSTAARKLLTERALRYLDSLRVEAGEDPALLRDVAAGYKRMGDVLGYQYRANLGDTAGALQSYRKSLAIRESLALRSPGPTDASRLAEAYRLVGEMLGVSNDLQGSMQNLRRALAVGEQAARDYPNDFEVLSELSQAYSAAADTLSGSFNSASMADNAGAVVFRQKMLEIDKRMLSLKPQDPEIRRTSAVHTVKLGDQLLLDGLWHEADGYYLGGRAIFEELAASQAQNATVLEQLQEIDTRLDTMKKLQGDNAGALEIDRAALRIAQQLSRKDPRDAQARLAVAIDYANMADALAGTGRRAEARGAMSEALRIVQEVVALSPKNAEFRGVQAGLYATDGDVYRAAGESAQALKAYRQAAGIVTQTQADDPANADARLRLAAVLNSEAAMLTSRRDIAAATTMYEKALQLADPDVRGSRPNEQALYSTADSYSGLGETQALLAIGAVSRAAQTAHWQRACSWYRRSLEVWKSVKEPALLSPDGFHVTPPTAVAQRLARCEGALSRLPQLK